MAFVAVLAYLAAVFVPCDPPFAFPVSRIEAAGSAHAHADDSSGSNEREDPAAAHARDDSHASGAAHSHAHSSDGHSRAEARAMVPAEARSFAKDSSNPTEQAHAALPESPISFKSQCLCGCDDVRGAVGGGASRLGSAIPADAVFALAARGVIVVPEAPPSRLGEGHPPSDAIPI